MFYPFLRTLLFGTLLLLALPGRTQVAELYSKASRALYESVEGKACGDFSAADLQKLKSTSLLCGYDAKALQRFGQGANEILEQAYFQQAAEAEVSSLQCAIDRVQSAKASSEFKSQVREDILKKLPLASQQWKEMIATEQLLQQQRGRANTLRPSGTDKRATTPQYEAELRKVKELEETRKSQNAAFEGLINSVWMGGTRAAKEHLKEFIRAGFSADAGQIQKFDQDFARFFTAIEKELKENKKSLLQQSQKVDGKTIYNNLGFNTKQALFKNPAQSDLLVQAAKEDPRLGLRLQCQLEGRYGRGTEYLDGTLFAGSLLASGGGALLARAPMTLRGTVATATRLSKMTAQSAQVLLTMGTATSMAQLTKELDRHCLAPTRKSQATRNLCALSKDQLPAAELAAMEEGNCTFAVAAGLLPAAFSSAVSQKSAKLFAPASSKASSLSQALSSTAVAASRGAKGLTGREPIPTGAKFDFTHSEGGVRRRVVTRTESTSDLPKSTRNLISGLKAKSKTMTPDEHERMALVVEYSDGTSKAVKLTSREFAGVRAADQDKAFAGSGISSSNKTITKVTHVHTHPDFRNPIAEGGRTDYIGPSLDDIRAFEEVRAGLRASNPSVKFEAIVAPSCEYCDKLIFRIGDEELDLMKRKGPGR